MNTPHPSASTPSLGQSRSHPTSRTFAAVAVGALALGGLAAVPAANAADDPVTSVNWLDGYFNNIGIADAGSQSGNIDTYNGFFVRNAGGLPSNDVLTLPGNDDTELAYTLSGGTEGVADNISLNYQDAPITVDTSLGLGSQTLDPATQLRFVGASTYGSIKVSVTLNYADDNDDETEDSSSPFTV